MRERVKIPVQEKNLRECADSQSSEEMLNGSPVASGNNSGMMALFYQAG